MIRAAWLGLLVVAACSGGGPASVNPPPPPPIPPPAVEAAYDPPPPTLQLPTHFAPKGYVARLAIDPAQPTFTGSIEITGNLDRRSAVIWLHGQNLHVHGATATHDKTTVDVRVTPRGDDLLELRPATPFPAGRYTLALTYDGAILPVGSNAGAFAVTFASDRYIVTQFEASSARLVFPCVDEPGVKTPWQLTLDVPKGLLAVSNAPVTHESPLDAGHVRVAFATTRPLPSYLIAFGVGPFEAIDAGHATSGAPLRVIVPHGQITRAAFAAAALPRIVQFLEAWTSIPFPYPKLDLLARDAGGAMENAGLITIDLGTVLSDPRHPSARAEHALISTVGHEVAHQWFGDLVTAQWWDDIWLNESFATWMEDKVVTALQPAWHDDGFAVTRRNYAFASDGLVSARRIRQPITTAGDIHNVFDGITYLKGSTVLGMFEARVGAEVFQRGIRTYLIAHADDTATVKDVINAVDAVSGQRLGPAFAGFLDQPGIPELDVRTACEAGKPARVVLAQHRYAAPGSHVPGAATTWQIPLCIAYDRADHARGEVCAWVDQPSVEIGLPSSACPTWVLPDGGAHAYVRPAYSEAQVVALRDRAWDKLSASERRGLFEAVRTETIDGRLPVELLMSFQSKLLAGDRFAVCDALGDRSSGTGARANGLPYGLANVIPGPLTAAVQKRIQTLVAAHAKKLGLAPRAGDDLEAEVERSAFVSSAAWAGDRGPAAEASALAAHYRDLSRSTSELALPIAIDASAKVAASIRADALVESDPELRRALFGNLGSIHDPERLRVMLDTALDPAVGARDVLALLDGWEDEPSRAVVDAWIRGHFGALQVKLPTVATEDFPPLLSLLGVFARACDAGHRDSDVAYLTQSFASLPSAARPTAQTIERLDQCIAQRALVEPSLRAWLAARAR